MCFTCNVCLVCWEPTDEPWSEHERHSPSCPFVRGEHTQNVPLSGKYMFILARKKTQTVWKDRDKKLCTIGRRRFDNQKSRNLNVRMLYEMLILE